MRPLAEVFDLQAMHAEALGQFVELRRRRIGDIEPIHAGMGYERAIAAQ